MDNVVITSCILRAFEIYKKAKNHRSERAMCRDFEISVATYGNWKHRRSDTIDINIWRNKIEPKLKSYIERAVDEQQYSSDRNPFSYQVTIGVYDDETKLKLKNLFEQVSKNLAELVSFNHVEQPITPSPIEFSYVDIENRVSAGNGLIPSEEKYGHRPDMDILTVDGESMSPTFIPGEKIIVHTFQERLTFGDEHLPMDIVKSLIPEDTVIIYNRNDSGLAMKRVKYEQGKGTWYFKLIADNEEWSKENKFVEIIKKTDDFEIFGKVIGKMK